MVDETAASLPQDIVATRQWPARHHDVERHLEDDPRHEQRAQQDQEGHFPASKAQASEHIAAQYGHRSGPDDVPEDPNQRDPEPICHIGQQGRLE